MGIQQIFISHAGKDAGVATELAQQLRNAGHDARIDTRDLALGDNAIEFMNEGISNAAAVIILFSGHSLKAEWQKLEIDAARWNEVAQGGGRCIVVRLDDTPLPPTLGPKAYGRLKPGRPRVSQETGGRHLQSTVQRPDDLISGRRGVQTGF